MKRLEQLSLISTKVIKQKRYIKLVHESFEHITHQYSQYLENLESSMIIEDSIICEENRLLDDSPEKVHNSLVSFNGNKNPDMVEPITDAFTKGKFYDNIIGNWFTEEQYETWTCYFSGCMHKLLKDYPDYEILSDNGQWIKINYFEDKEKPDRYHFEEWYDTSTYEEELNHNEIPWLDWYNTWEKC